MKEIHEGQQIILITNNRGELKGEIIEIKNNRAFVQTDPSVGFLWQIEKKEDGTWGGDLDKGSIKPQKQTNEEELEELKNII